MHTTNFKEANNAHSTDEEEYGSSTSMEGGSHSSVNHSLSGQNAGAPLSYERDLWDSITLLNDNSWIRLNFVKNLRTFFFSYKKALEVFNSSLQKATV